MNYSSFTLKIERNSTYYLFFVDLISIMFAYVIASLDGNFDKIKESIKNNFDIDYEYPLDRYTALMRASVQGRIDIIRYLLDYGANINKLNTAGETALVEAVCHDQLNSVKTLLEYNADANLIGSHCRLPLVYACQKHNLDIAKVLLKHGADVNILDKEGWPNYLSIYNIDEDILKLILSYKPAINSEIACNLYLRAIWKNNIELFNFLTYSLFYFHCDDKDVKRIETESFKYGVFEDLVCNMKYYLVQLIRNKSQTTFYHMPDEMIHAISEYI